jgi:hypothetical protein
VSYTDDWIAPPNIDGRMNTTIALPGSGAGADSVDFTINDDWQPVRPASSRMAKPHRINRIAMFPLWFSTKVLSLKNDRSASVADAAVHAASEQVGHVCPVWLGISIKDMHDPCALAGSALLLMQTM